MRKACQWAGNLTAPDFAEKMSFNNWCWLAHKAKQTSEKRLDPDSIEIQLFSSGRWRLYGDLGESRRKNETSLGATAAERCIDWGKGYRAPCLGSSSGILLSASS